MNRSHISFVILAIPLLFVFLAPIVSLLGVSSFVQIWDAFQNTAFLDALWVSCWTSAMSLILTIVFGTPLAWWISQHKKSYLWEDICMIPLLMPPTVVGLGLLYTFGQQGFFGDILSHYNIRIAFHPTAVVIAQIVVAAPLYIRTMTHTFRSIPSQSLVVGATLGFSYYEIFHRIIVPSSKEGIISASILTWARAIGEFGATLLFAGNLQGYTQTMPLAIYNAFEHDIHLAVSLSISLIMFCLFLFLLLRVVGSRT